MLKKLTLLTTLLIGCISMFATIYNVSTSEELQAALLAVSEGDEIVIPAGTTINYDNGALEGAYFYSAGEGSETKPITIRSSSLTEKAGLSGTNVNSKIVLRIVGDWWVVKNLDISNGKKGLIFDNSSYSKAINCEVHDVGEEAIHVRDGSDYVTIDGCKVYNTGRYRAAVGEGIYVGSAVSSHSRYNKNVDYTTIKNCVMGPDITAEAFDIKEGTMETVVEYNIVDAKGINGSETGSYEDSFIDLKGIRAYVRYNTFNQNGEPKILRGVGLYNRNTELSGYENVIHDNIFNMDDGRVVLVEGGDNTHDNHAYDNTRNPVGTMYSAEILETCPAFYTLCTADPISVTGVELSPASLTVNKGQIKTITATVLPVNATNKRIEWSSSNTSFATIDQSGYVSAIAEGSALITAKSDDGDFTAVCSVTVTDIALPQYTLNVNTVGLGAVVLSPLGGVYEEGTMVTLTATPESGYAFSGWSGDAIGSAVTTSLTMESDKNVTAAFEEKIVVGCDNPLTITMPFEKEGLGVACFTTTGTITKIQSWSAGYIEINGVDITNDYITELPPKINGRYEIYYEGNLNWSHLEIEGVNSEITQFSLVTSVVGQGNILPSGGSYNKGANISVVAIPENGWKFNGWSGDLSGDSDTVNLIMDTNKVVAATFIKEKIDSCDIEIPMLTALQTLNMNFVNAYVKGDGPNLGAVSKVEIDWNKADNRLNKFVLTTNTGVPDYTLDLLSKQSNSFDKTEPSITLNGTGISKLDGDYFVAYASVGLVLKSKSEDYSIYFSNETVAPCGSVKQIQSSVLASGADNIKIYPNPIQDIINIKCINSDKIQSVQLYSIMGQLLHEIKKPGIKVAMSITPQSPEKMYLIKIQMLDKMIIRTVVARP